eukprot:gb/GECG01009184.1/.p1 GENE.gb/GECG01009184.1/~~gb/GECG01009184.1/.p1  ORF type:complete len:446 (+),score=51.67 gb/GECG01009184.1/:1-1338(+)
METNGQNEDELQSQLSEYNEYHLLQLTLLALEAHTLHEDCKLASYLEARQQYERGQHDRESDVEEPSVDDRKITRLQQLHDALLSSSLAWKQCPAEAIQFLIEIAERCLQSSRICSTITELRNTLRVFCSGEIDPKIAKYFPTLDSRTDRPSSGLLVPLEWVYGNKRELGQRLDNLKEIEQSGVRGFPSIFYIENPDKYETVENALSSCSAREAADGSEETSENNRQDDTCKDNSDQQLRRDIERDEFQINGSHVSGGTVHFEGVVTTLKDTIESVLCIFYNQQINDRPNMDSLVREILRIANRTKSGGDSFDSANRLFINSDHFCLMPDSVAAPPIRIHVDFGPTEFFDQEPMWTGGLRFSIECITVYRVGQIDDPEETNEDASEYVRGQLLPWSRRVNAKPLSNLRLTCVYRRYLYSPFSVASGKPMLHNCIDDGGHVHFILQ